MIPAAHPEPAADDPEKDVWRNPKCPTAATPGAYAKPDDIKYYLGDQRAKTGMHALRDADIFTMLCVPDFPAKAPDEEKSLDLVAKFCGELRAMLIADLDPATIDATETLSRDFPISKDNRKNAVVYFPQLKIADPTQDYAVVDALLLSPDERVHLHRLAKVADGSVCPQSAPPARTVRPTVHALLDRPEPPPRSSSTRDELSITVGAEFSRRFANAAVLPSWAGTQKWKHPRLGDLHLAYESLAVSGAEDLRLVVYVQGMSSTRPS